MASTRRDLFSLCSLLGFNKNTFRNLFISRLYVNSRQIPGLCLTGPFVGSPYGVMLLEEAIAWGAGRIIFIGWCGAVSSKVKIGDIILPASAMIDEGTSRHYLADCSVSRPSANLLKTARRMALDTGLTCHEGAVCSTDAVYRETREKLSALQSKDVLAVDMEVSSIFTVACCRKVDVLAVLVVSDDLSTGNRLSGFSDDNFKKGRMAACILVQKLCKSL